MTKNQLIAVLKAYINGGIPAAEKQMHLYVDSERIGGDTGYPYSYASHLMNTAPAGANMDYFLSQIGSEETNSQDIANFINQGTKKLGGKIFTVNPKEEEEPESEKIADLINKETIDMLERPDATSRLLYRLKQEQEGK